MTVIVYNYHSETKEYLYSSFADYDPIDNEPLIPANSTTNTPPKVPQNRVAVFNGNGWSVKYDYRGYSGYDENRNLIEIKDIGIKPDESWTSEIIKTQEEIRSEMKPLSAFQVRKVLRKYNLRDSVEAAVSQASLDIQDGWNYAKEFQRLDPILLAMASVLSFSDELLDELFEEGIKL